MEWQVTRSDVVVRATISKVERDKPQDQFVYIAVTLNVNETLKGTKSNSLTYLAKTLAGDKRYEEWRDAKTEFIVFLVKNEAFRKGGSLDSRTPLRILGDGWGTLRLGPPVAADDEIRSFPTGVFDMNLNVAVTPERLLKAVRKAASFGRGDKETNSHDLKVSREVMQWSGTRGDTNSIIMPVDPRLEVLAREMITIPGQILANRGSSRYKREQMERLQNIRDKELNLAATAEARQETEESWRRSTESEKNSLRYEGLMAIRYFRSDKNVSLVKPLLRDNAVLRYEHSRVWFIRKAAYETLTEWGVKVEKPILEWREAPKK